MKRLIAVLLTVLMVASVCSVFSFAEDVNLVRGIDGVGVDGKVVVGYDKYNANLTDGEAVEAIDYNVGKWFGFYRNVDDKGVEYEKTNAPGKLGTLVYDLGKTCTINKARIHTYLGNKDGIKSPKKITVSVSEDGTTYTEFASKSFTAPAAGNTDTAWVELTGTALAGKFVKVEVELDAVFAFLNEVEVYGTEGAPATTPDPVAHEITVDGKFDEALWTDARKVDTTLWQGVAENDPQPEIAASYKVLADDENIYLAVTVADKWNYKDTTYQSGATNFRIWMLGDADYATENKRTFFDVTLKEDGTFALYYMKEATDKIEAKAVSTADTENVAVEFKINKAAINATNGFKMMVTYSSPAIAEEGKTAAYNALHITPAEYTAEGKLPDGWSGSAVLYQEFVYADGVVTKFGETTDTSNEPSTDASTDTSSTGTDTPVTGDAGVIALVVMAVVAAFGSAVLVKARR